MCEEESILLKLTLGDGSQDESEAETMPAALFSTSSRKKRRISLESVTSLPASNETN